MAHFAQLDKNKVIQVIVVNNEEVPDEETGIQFCKNLFGENTTWVQTSYNGKFRSIFAGIGMSYSVEDDEFKWDQSVLESPSE